MEDQELLRQLHSDPDRGMELLIGQYAGLVHAVVRGKLSSLPAAAGDIEGCVADVFSEFYFDLDKYDPQRGSIRAWLCVMAGHNAIDCLRKHGRERDMVRLDDAGACGQYANDFSLEGNFEEEALRQELMTAIRALGPPDHEILVRKFYLCQPSKEIAERLNMTVSNVDTRTHRAIRKLRQTLGGNR